MKVLEVSGEIRSDLGKKNARALRREGKILCEMYGGDENVHFTVVINEVKKLVYTSQFQLVDLNVGGKTYRAFMKEIQFHPVTDEIQHIDFQELVEGRKIKVAVPIVMDGISPGVKEGGKLYAKVRYLKIKTTPEHLVDSVHVDISEMMLGQSVRVRDIVVADGIEVMNNPNIPVASVEVPRLLKLEEEVEVDGEEGEEGEEGAEGEGGEAAAESGDKAEGGDQG